MRCCSMKMAYTQNWALDAFAVCRDEVVVVQSQVVKGGE